MEKQQSPFNKQGLLHLAVIYLVWGSTYLAIRVGVREGSGFPPFFLGGTRALAACAILLTWNALKGSRIRLQKGELLPILASGLALWLGGNGLVMQGEKFVDSSLAALVISGVPLWTALMESLLDRRPLTWRMVAAILTGILGIAVLSIPNLQSGVQANIQGTLMVLIGSVCWATGTVIQSRFKYSLAPTVNSAYQMLFGGVAFILFALILKEPFPQPRADAWMAWGYLVLFGSIIAFTSYLKALRLLPTRIVTTYSYVNPLVALALGFLILRESITPWTIAGTMLILVGVYGVFKQHAAENAGPRPQRPPRLRRSRLKP